jgi:hypothetical protein
MFKRIFAVAAAASLSVLGATAAAQAQAQPRARPAGHLHGVRVVNLHRAFEAQLAHTKVGKISGVVYARGHRPKAAANTAATCTEPACPVAWHTGTVQHTPHVYLVLWGPNWQTDPNATYLENFLSGLGNNQAQDNWSTITSQYADATGAPSFSGLVYEGVTIDTNVPPKNTSLDQIGAEADTIATNLNITDLADAQIIVATQSGTCPQGFAGTACTGGTRNNCGYHSSSNQPFINLPYEPDAGAPCGEDSVNPAPGGNTDGFSIIGGALYASTITDPNPPSGWIDLNDPAGGSEIGGKCTAQPGFDLTLSTSTTPFAVSTLWSNAANACVQTGAIKDSIKITSPGTQTSNVGAIVNLPIVGASTAGNPLAWTETGLPAGLTIGASTGTITGTPTTPGTSGVTVTATDEAGAHHSLSFNWTINAAVTSGPIKGDHGKCLDDFGGGTANGNKVDIWTCNNTTSQKWTFSGGHLMVLGKCLNDASHTGAGTNLVIWGCNTHKGQLWKHRSNGEYVLQLNGLCLTDPSASSVNGTQVQIHACQNFADQHWSLP